VLWVQPLTPGLGVVVQTVQSRMLLRASHLLHRIRTAAAAGDWGRVGPWLVEAAALELSGALRGEQRFWQAAARAHSLAAGQAELVWPAVAAAGAAAGSGSGTVSACRVRLGELLGVRDALGELRDYAPEAELEAARQLADHIHDLRTHALQLLAAPGPPTPGAVEAFKALLRRQPLDLEPEGGGDGEGPMAMTVTGELRSGLWRCLREDAEVLESHMEYLSFLDAARRALQQGAMGGAPGAVDTRPIATKDLELLLASADRLSMDLNDGLEATVDTARKVLQLRKAQQAGAWEMTGGDGSGGNNSSSSVERVLISLDCLTKTKRDLAGGVALLRELELARDELANRKLCRLGGDALRTGRPLGEVGQRLVTGADRARLGGLLDWAMALARPLPTPEAKALVATAAKLAGLRAAAEEGRWLLLRHLLGRLGPGAGDSDGDGGDSAVQIHELARDEVQCYQAHLRHQRLAAFTAQLGARPATIAARDYQELQLMIKALHSHSLDQPLPPETQRVSPSQGPSRPVPSWGCCCRCR
jgi:hypothetical protein